MVCVAGSVETFLNRAYILKYSDCTNMLIVTVVLQAHFSRIGRRMRP